LVKTLLVAENWLKKFGGIAEKSVKIGHSQICRQSYGFACTGDAGKKITTDKKLNFKLLWSKFLIIFQRF